MPIFPTAVESAQARLQSLQSAYAGALEKIAVQEEHLRSLRASQSDVEMANLLGTDGPDAGRLRQEIRETGDSIAAMQSALPALRERIREAIGDKAKAEASGVRKQAEKAQERLDKHTAKTAELLAALETHAGAGYAQQTVHLPAPGVPFMPGELRPVVSTRDRLQAEINGLLSEAARIESAAKNAIETGGRATGEGLADLLQACANPEILAPAPAEVTAWHRQAVVKSAIDWRRTGFTGKYRTIYTIVWKSDGVLDQQQSGFVNSQVSPFEDGTADRQHQAWVDGHKLSGGVGAGAMQTVPRI
jgi:hypothetical protein